MRRRIVQWVAVVVGLFYLVTGLWAFFAPRSFFEQVATFAPYNHHLLHDGAFQAGLGLVLLLALWWSDALRAALLAALIASALHTISHLVDRDLGGRATDLPFLLLVFALLAVAAVIRLGKETHGSDQGDLGS